MYLRSLSVQYLNGVLAGKTLTFIIIAKILHLVGKKLLCQC